MVKIAGICCSENGQVSRKFVAAKNDPVSRKFAAAKNGQVSRKFAAAKIGKVSRKAAAKLFFVNSFRFSLVVMAIENDDDDRKENFSIPPMNLVMDPNSYKKPDDQWSCKRIPET